MKTQVIVNNPQFLSHLSNMVSIPCIDRTTADHAEMEQSLFRLYIITPQTINPHTIAEAISDSIHYPTQTILCVIEEYENQSLTAEQKLQLYDVGRMIKSNGGSWRSSIDKVATYINQRTETVIRPTRVFSANLQKPNFPERAVIRPQELVTKTLVRIHVDGCTISLLFPEKLELFKNIMYVNEYKWHGETRRYRKILPRSFAHLTQDRAAEIAHILIENGFCVMLPTKQAQSKLLDGTYSPESKRWIDRVPSGTYENYFRIDWARSEHDDVLDEAKKLTAQKWVPNSYMRVVPPEHYEEILEFAAENGFVFTPDAQILLSEAEAIFEQALIPQLPERKTAEDQSRIPVDFSVESISDQPDSELVDN